MQSVQHTHSYYPISTVPSHDYTCYDSTTKKHVTNTITEAVYTTTIGDPKAVLPIYDKYNYDSICYHFYGWYQWY